MNKRLNWPLVLSLLIGTPVLGASIYGIHELQQWRNAGSLEARAQRAHDEGDIKEAIRLKRRYLMHRQDDLDALLALAIDMKKFFDRIQTDFELREEVDVTKIVRQTVGTLDLAVRKVESSDRLAELYREYIDFQKKYTRDWPVVEEFLGKLAKIDGESLTADDELTWAICDYKSNYANKAKDRIYVMIGYDVGSGMFDVEKARFPDSIEAYSTLANLALIDGEDDFSLEVINQMVTANDEDAQARLARARYFNALPDVRSTSERDFKQLAREDIQEAFRLAPDDLQVVITAVEDLLRENAADQAKQMLDEVAEKHPEEPEIFLGLANWAYRTRDLEKAKSYIKEGLKKHPEDARMVWFKANIDLETEDNVAFDKSLLELERLNYSPLLIQYLRGRHEVANNDFAKAEQRLVKLRPLLPQFSDEVDRLLLICYRTLRYWDQVLLVADRLLENDPKHELARASKGMALKSLGRTREYDHFVMPTTEDGDEDVSVATLLNRLQVLINREKLKDEGDRDWQAVDNLANQIKQDADLPMARKVLLQAQLLFQKEQREQAIKLLNTALARDQFAGERALWLLLYQIEQGTDRGKQTLAKMNERFGDDVGMRLLRAEQINRSNLDSGVKLEQIRSLESNAGHFTEAQRLQLLNGLSKHYVALRSYDDADRCWKAIAKANPRDIRVRLAAFDLANQTDDEEGMLTALDEIKKVAGESSEWLLAKATYILRQVRMGIADESDIDKVRGLVQRVRAQRADWPALQQIDAEIALLTNDLNAALEALQKAYAQQPSNTLLLRQIIQLLNSMGRGDEADRFLASVPQDQINAVDPMTKVIMLEKNERFEEAAAELERIVPLNSNNINGLIQLGQLLAKLDDRKDDAELALRRALALDPTSAQTWLPLVSFLSKIKQRQDEAEATIRDAQKTLSQRQLATVLGKCYEAAGLPNEAEAAYRDALFGSPDNIELQRELSEVYIRNGRVPDAEPLLARMIDEPRTDRSAVDNKRWARRQMAKVLNAQGGYQEFKDARDLLEANKPEDGELSEEDAILYMAMSANRPDNDSRRKAVQRITQIRNSGKRELSANEIFLLAQIHEKLGNWNEADSLIKDLIQSGASNYRVLEMYIGWLLDREDTREAQIWRNKLPARSTVRIKANAEILLKQGDVQRARQEIAKLIPDKITSTSYQQLRELGAFMERLGEKDAEILKASETVVRKYVEQFPDLRLDLAAFLGRRDDKKSLIEALKICKASLTDETKLDRALEIAVTILRVHYKTFPPGSAIFKEVASWFPKLKKQYPDSDAMYMPLAELETQRGNTSAVVATYQEFLKRDDLSPLRRAVIQNNLSFALAIDGKTTEALQLINEAIDYLGPTGDLLDTRAMAYIIAKKPQNAIKDLEQAVLQIGESGERLFHLALAKDLDRQRDEARDLLQRAHDLGLKEEDLSIQQRPLYRKIVKSLGMVELLSRK